MAMTLLQVKEYLQDPDNRAALDKVGARARELISAASISGDAYNFMIDSLLNWLSEANGTYPSLDHVDVDDIAAANDPSPVERGALITWAWEYSFEPGEPDLIDRDGSVDDMLESVIDAAAIELEEVAIRALIDVWPELNGD